MLLSGTEAQLDADVPHQLEDKPTNKKAAANITERQTQISTQYGESIPPSIPLHPAAQDTAAPEAVDHPNALSTASNPTSIPTSNPTVGPAGSPAGKNTLNKTSTKIVKLFAGQIPKTMDVDDVIELFSICGKVTDASIIYNNCKVHQRCAFVFMEHDNAMKAVERFHNVKKLDPVSDCICVVSCID